MQKRLTEARIWSADLVHLKGLGSSCLTEGFCVIAVLLFASRFGHDPLLDVPDDGRLVAARI